MPQWRMITRAAWSYFNDNAVSFHAYSLTAT
jgi:hypothetical protein